ncbi:MAG: M20/M25/M40 family metallo-hydrolase, partial [Gemmatimonadota bacterium]
FSSSRLLVFSSSRLLVFSMRLLVALLLAPSLAAAQSAAVRAGAESISESNVRSRIGIIADDSMGGRDTPSRGLDLTASYIAGEFARFGLVGALDSSRFVQRYGVGRTRLDGERSRATFSAEGQQVVATARRDLVYVFGPRTGRRISAPVILVGGPLQLDSAKVLPIEGKILVVVGDAKAPNATPVNQFLSNAFERNPVAVIMVMNNDTVTFARQIANQFRERSAVEGEDATDAVVTMVHERALGSIMRAAGVDLAQFRRSPAYTVRTLPTLTVSVTLADEGGGGHTAPNVVGVLEGSDPVLKNEYIIFSAHMDHVGTNPRAKGDSIWNGADDDASGTAGVVELAEAFSQPGARPKRSLIFLTVSGEEKGLWGSEYFVSHSPIPMSQVVADINIDMIGRNWRDTIVAIGREHSDLGATLDRVGAEHPELNMHAIDDLWPDENFYFRSDHYNFARRGVPILFFFNGTHRDYHQASDSPDKIDAEKEARILRLIYYLGHELGNAPQRPVWNPGSYKKIVDRKLVP